MAHGRQGTRAHRALLLAAFAFATCLLVSSSAWATGGVGTGGLGACSSAASPTSAGVAPEESVAEVAATLELAEPEPLMTPTPLGVVPPTKNCAEADDDGLAPMCDPAGASTLAPRLLRAIEDSRIEAPPPCPEQWVAAFAPSSNPKHADAAAAKDFLEAATLPTPAPRISRAPTETAICHAEADALPTAHCRGVYRPPAS